jgi:hypothetical protein
MKLLDTVSVDDASVKRTSDGYLVANARVSRANNIQRYTGAEMDKPDMPIVRVYRPESEVFARDSMSSAAHKPLTNDHPSESVSADTWKRDAIGQMGDEITRDGEYLRIPLIMMDSSAINDYEAGKRELSMGYTADIDWTAGMTDSGEEYDAVQRDIRINHLALVAAGRAGSAVRIGDWHNPLAQDSVPNHINQEGRIMAETRKVVIDGLTIDTTDQGAQAIEKLQKQLTDAATSKSDTQTTHDAAIAVKDGELAKKDGEIDALKAQVMDAEALDKAVTERADLIGKAKAIVDVDYTGKSPAEIRKAAVVAKLGDEAVKDKAEAYVDARFDILVETVDNDDPVRAALNTRDTTAKTDNGYNEYVNRISNAYKQEAH